MNARSKKRIAVVDADPALAELILDFVRDMYDIELTNDKDADYVFHSVKGYDVLKYSGIRIFISGENVSPNFGISDYAMTFDRLVFGDRYTWLPLIKLYRESYAALVRPRPPADEILRLKTEFCAYVMSNTTDSADERSRVFDSLSAYRKVNSGGLWRNNVGGRVPDKRIFQAKHKFVIAFENCSYPGYLTEKFADAASSDAIPIYWGDPGIASILNPRSFVNCHDYDTFEDVAEAIRKLDTDDDLYLEMLSEPWFPGGVEPDFLGDKHFVRFLSNILDQEPEVAYRRNRGRWGRKKERQLYEMWAKPHLHSLKLLRSGWRTITHSVRPRRKNY